jgi:hypothetical protein
MPMRLSSSPIIREMNMKTTVRAQVSGWADIISSPSPECGWGHWLAGALGRELWATSAEGSAPMSSLCIPSPRNPHTYSHGIWWQGRDIHSSVSPCRQQMPTCGRFGRWCSQQAERKQHEEILEAAATIPLDDLRNILGLIRLCSQKCFPFG